MWTPRVFAECCGCGQKLRERFDYPLLPKDPDIIKAIREFINEHWEHGRIAVDTY